MLFFVRLHNITDSYHTPYLTEQAPAAAGQAFAVIQMEINLTAVQGKVGDLKDIGFSPRLFWAYPKDFSQEELCSA